ncbi:Fe-S cluster assembly protein SufD [Nanchangia anserum]|uniref:Fe-S cluster assembly protein SufD n=1 Tax=Nanchangia anserum TaxID=2692125 RepID=UPI001D116204|nr:Fe-S cluster assembly protein SufD [Nanchangia anserum]
MSEISITQDKAASSRADRASSFELADLPVPTGREEDWRFTPIERVRDLFDPATYGGTVLPTVEGPDAVTVEEVERGDERLGRVQAPGDRTSVVAWNTFERACVLTVPRGAQVDEPIYVRYAGAQRGAPQASHLVIDVAADASAQIILEHTGSLVMNGTVEVNVGENASLELVSLQEWDAEAVHACAHRMNIGGGAKLKHVVVTLGGETVRLTPDVNFVGEGAEVEMLGLYFTDTDQHHEHRLYVDHDLRNCRSRVTYKGALQGQRAHAVWIGDVLIGSGAFGTDSYELNRNLVLNEGAKADSVPNLEIENGDIEGAGHASATGRFDDEQLFYLMSRGMDESTARKLVVHGFFAELIHQIEIPHVEQRLLDAVDAELEAGGNL